MSVLDRCRRKKFRRNLVEPLLPFSVLNSTESLQRGPIGRRVSVTSRFRHYCRGILIGLAIVSMRFLLAAPLFAGAITIYAQLLLRLRGATLPEYVPVYRDILKIGLAYAALSSIYYLIKRIWNAVRGNQPQSLFSYASDNLTQFLELFASLPNIVSYFMVPSLLNLALSTTSALLLGLGELVSIEGLHVMPLVYDYHHIPTVLRDRISEKTAYRLARVLQPIHRVCQTLALPIMGVAGFLGIANLTHQFLYDNTFLSFLENSIIAAVVGAFYLFVPLICHSFLLAARVSSHAPRIMLALVHGLAMLALSYVQGTNLELNIGFSILGTAFNLDSGVLAGISIVGAVLGLTMGLFSSLQQYRATQKVERLHLVEHSLRVGALAVMSKVGNSSDAKTAPVQRCRFFSALNFFCCGTQRAALRQGAFSRSGGTPPGEFVQQTGERLALVEGSRKPFQLY